MKGFIIVPLKILAAWLQQETNTFNVNKTDLDHFRVTSYLEGDAIKATYAGTRTDWGALFEFAALRQWTVHAPLHAHAVPFGTLRDTAFETLTGVILSGIREAGPVDAILLMLHGSLVAESHQDCDGELISRVRQLVGAHVPIIVTVDPHANVTAAMAANANAITAYRTTPHVDQYETTHRALGLLDRIVNERLRTRVDLFRPPVLSGLDSGRTITGEGPMVDALALAAKLDGEHDDVLAISVQAGFPFADIAEVGPSIAVTLVDRNQSSDDIGAPLAELIWRTRATRSITLLDLDKAFVKLQLVPLGRGPVVLVDYTDNPGGGANGDGTSLLERMLSARLKNAGFFAIADSSVAEIAHRAGPGARISVSLGGKASPSIGGTPLQVEVVVIALSDGAYVRKGAYFTGTQANLGRSALLDIDGIKVIVTSHPNQTEEREQFRLFGLEFGSFDVVGCKAMNHFRADLEHLSRELIFVDSGGICSPDLSRLPYRRVRRPIWPLDEDVAYESGFQKNRPHSAA